MQNQNPSKNPTSHSTTGNFSHSIGWAVPQTNPLQYSFGVSSIEMSASSSTSSNFDFSVSNDSPKTPTTNTQTGSKRSRQVIADDSDSDSEMNSNSPPPRSVTLRNITQNSPAIRQLSTQKRVRAALEGSPASNTSNLVSNPQSETPQLMKRVAQLDKDQLVGLFNGILSAYPFLSSHVAALIPRPTLSSATSQLQALERRLEDGFPYSRSNTVDNRSDYAYNRVRSTLTDIRVQIFQDVEFFTNPASYPQNLAPEYPVNSFGYLHMATSFIHRLPVWDNELHNVESREVLYRHLVRSWKRTIAEIGRRVKFEGKLYSQAVVGEWATNLLHHYTTVECGYGFREVVEEFRIHLGQILGFQNQIQFWDAVNQRQSSGEGQSSPTDRSESHNPDFALAQNQSSVTGVPPMATGRSLFPSPQKYPSPSFVMHNH